MNPRDAERAARADDVLRAIGDVVPALADQLHDADERRALPAPVVGALIDAGVFRLAVAADYGGCEAPPRHQIEAVEALSRIDGSLGWCAMIGVSGGYVSGLLDPGVARALFGPRDAVMAGQIVPAARAERVEGGYRVSGRCRFASGIAHATIINVGSAVHTNGEPTGQVRSMLVPRSAVTVIETWDTTGMRGTGSHDFVIDDVFVADASTFSAFDPPRVDRPLYRFPPLFLVPHAGVPLGLAQGALDAVHSLARSKHTAPSQHAGAPPSLLRDDPLTQATIAQCETALAAARALAYTTVDDLWQTLDRVELLTTRQRALYRSMLVYVHRECRDIVTRLYDIAATSAIMRSNPLDQQLRDIVTACQHRVVQEKMLRFAGQLLLDLPAGDPFF